MPDLSRPVEAVAVLVDAFDLTTDLFVPIPAGITASTVTNYRVGPYNYTDLELAKAELERQRSAR